MLFGQSAVVRPSARHYKIGVFPVTGTGLGVGPGDLAEAISGPVAAIVFDDPGTEQVAALLAGVADTEFARSNLSKALAYDQELEDWRVGEAIAESYLSECKGCYFPWPDSRDERKRRSSLPGADLVGFQRDGNTERFAFGEVKTSSDQRYPPGTMHGPHGLKQQMEDLRDREDIRKTLFFYLAVRANNAPWQERFKAASRLYLQDSTNVRLFGVIVRDVAPHQDDLRARVEKLKNGCSTSIAIELIAVYLPPATIPTLPEKVIAARQTGAAS